MNENVIKMARIMVGCKDRTCEDCLSQSKKLFGDNKCALIEYAEVLDKAGYRKQSDVITEFVVKAEQRFREDSKWLDIMIKCYYCKDSEDYDAVANAIIRGRFVNRLNDLAEQYCKEE